MKQITWKWVGGREGHYEIYVDGQLVQTCDEGEINKKLTRLRDKLMLKEELNAWIEKVVSAKENGGMVDTYAMIAKVDKIIANAFDHEPVISE